MSEMAEKLVAAEQEATIWKGRTELLERDQNVGAAKRVMEEMEKLKVENGRLRKDITEMKVEKEKKEREWEEWRRGMKAFIDGK